MDEPDSVGIPVALAEVRAQARPLAEAFATAGHDLALVGGVVRDHLLGEVVEHDLDATTDARPPAIKALVAGLADAVWTQGERFGTIGCQIDGQPWEITTYRAEAYDDDSRKPVVSFGDDLESDLARRDFTINAMALDLHHGIFIDPFGGAADLAAGRLATPLDPEISFSDDPLRMLRAARFVARFDLAADPELVAAIEAMGERMSIVSIERVFDELSKLLVLPNASRGLQFLAATGLWSQVLPALTWDNRIGDRVDRTSVVSARRWAALLLDHPDAGSVMRRLRASSATTRVVEGLVEVQEWPSKPGDRWIRQSAAERAAGAFDEQIAFGRNLRLIDGDGVGDALARLRRAEVDLDNPVPPLSGLEVADILGVEPGPVVGRALGWLAEVRYQEGPLTPVEARARLAEWSDPLLAGPNDE